MNPKYSHEQKQAIINRHMVEKELAAEIIANIGISKSAFYRWIREYQKEQAKRYKK